MRRSNRSLLSLMFLLVFVFEATQATPVGKTEPASEPNNRMEEAQPIVLPCLITGLFAERLQPDYYTFTVPPEGLASLYAVLTLDGDADPILRLLDDKGQKLNDSDFFKEGRGEYLTSLLLDPGTYFLYIDIHNRGKERTGLPYSLSLDQVPEVSAAEVREALNKALDYLVSIQEENGGYQVKMGKVAMPGFVIQALLGAECLDRDDWKTIYRAIDFLKTHYHDPAEYEESHRKDMQAGGIFFHKDLYEHAVALTALIEAYAMGVEEDLPEIIRHGLGFILRAQCTEDRPATLNGPISRESIYHGGWRYAVNAKDADISVTGWQIITLIAAKAAGFDVPGERMAWALEFVRRCYDEHFKEFAYRPAGRIGTGRSAMGAFSMQLLGAGGEPEVEAALKTILTRAPTWEGESGGGYPFYYWYYGTRAAYLAGGETWDLWHKAVCGMLKTSEQ